MGMTIDKAIPKIQFVRNALNDDMEIAKAYDLAIDTMRKYQKIKAEYENRLKADMVAMLTEIQLEIEEEAWKQGCASSNDREDEAYKIYYFIQQKIDKLKEVEE